MSEKIQIKPRALSTVLEWIPQGPPRLLLVTGARQTRKTTLATGRWGGEEGGIVETYAVSEMHKWSRWLGGVCLHQGDSIEERDHKRNLWAVPINRWLS